MIYTDNCKEIRPGVYLVKTQAGFKKAFKNEFYNFAEDKKNLLNWPEHYPAIISFNHDLHFENGKIETFIAYKDDFNL